MKKRISKESFRRLVSMSPRKRKVLGQQAATFVSHVQNVCDAAADLLVYMFVCYLFGYRHESHCLNFKGNAK